MTVEFPPPRWAVDELIPEGLTIMAGQPKIGKSWLMLGLGLAVASGGRAFGSVKVRQGDCLYLALEDTLRRLQGRLGAILGGSAPPNRLRLETAWPRSHRGGIVQIDKWLGAHLDARLVIVDTLTRFRPVTKESGYQQDYAAIEGLQDIAGDRGVAIVVVHHQRKMAAEDWVDTISGTLGLSGAADGMIAIFRDRETRDAELRLTGRDVEDAKRAVRWDAQTATWTLIDASQIQLNPERMQIRELVREVGPLTPIEVARHLHKNPSTVRTLIQRMVDQEQLEAKGDGRYGVETVDAVDSVDALDAVDTRDGGDIGDAGDRRDTRDIEDTHIDDEPDWLLSLERHGPGEADEVWEWTS